MRPRLYLDEDVIPDLARLLRARGFDALSAHERASAGQTDEQQLEFATAEHRAILTFNFAAYLRLGDVWFEAKKQHAGIIVSYRQYAHRQLGELLRATVLLLNQVSAEELRGTVRILDEFSLPG